MNKILRLSFLASTILLVSFTEVNCQQNELSTDDRKHPGFFGGIFEIGGLIKRQYTDTTGTLQKILDLLNDSFSDTATTKKPPRGQVTTTTDPSVETTTKYKISRKELGQILNKNYRGLQKLLRIELNDAWNQTKYSIADYKKEYNDQVKKNQLANQRKRKTSNDKR